MDHLGAVAGLPMRVTRRALIIVNLALVLGASTALTGSLSGPPSVQATIQGSRTSNERPSLAAPAALKAVIIVGPAGSLTRSNLEDAEALAVVAEYYGMDVRRVFHPHATWDAVMANIQGANLVVYMGHGNGWPSPYTPYQEKTKNGIGVNPYDGASQHETVYYGANQIRANWDLAPNALVFLNHDCYTAGNGEPGMAIPSWDVARQRVDNFAAGFLAVGARAVFAYSWQQFNKTLSLLFTTDRTMEDIFREPGYRPNAYFGWIGADPRKFASERTPGATNFLDPDPEHGFLRAVSGDLGMTAGQWSQDAPPDDDDDSEVPVITDLEVQPDTSPTFATPRAPVFSPNGDGVTEVVDLSFTLDREAFVDLQVTDASGAAVRTMSAWSPAGSGDTSWDGKNDAGSYVPDGLYTLTATPRSRAGLSGDPDSLDVAVATTMSRPAASPDLFYSSDGDELGRVTDLSVTLDEAATFWWKIADQDGRVVRTYINGAVTAAGSLAWAWDGRDGAGSHVPEGTYYSVTTTATAAGISSHAVAIEVRAFRSLTTTSPAFARGAKTKFYVSSAEPLAGKPKVRFALPGLAAVTYRTKRAGAAWWLASISVPAAAQAGTVKVTVYGTDAGGQVQYTDFYYQLQ